MIEAWVGLECTVNRVGDRYFDQVERTGHGERVTDIDRIAALGVGRLRYPVLWERIAPDDPDMAKWHRVDSHLHRLRALGLAPIAGLMHHGSGPSYTDLLNPHFPALLANYASAVASRFPWIDAWTPINEPMVTARFSGLYGHWYPHHHGERSFVRMVLHQAQAIVLSMQAIRRINPTAEYVHAEDGGTVYSAPPARVSSRLRERSTRPAAGPAVRPRAATPSIVGLPPAERRHAERAGTLRGRRDHT